MYPNIAASASKPQREKPFILNCENKVANNKSILNNYTPKNIVNLFNQNYNSNNPVKVANNLHLMNLYPEKNQYKNDKYNFEIKNLNCLNNISNVNKLNNVNSKLNINNYSSNQKLFARLNYKNINALTPTKIVNKDNTRIQDLHKI